MPSFIESKHGVPIIFFIFGALLATSTDGHFVGLGMMIVGGLIRIAWAIEER